LAPNIVSTKKIGIASLHFVDNWQDHPLVKYSKNTFACKLMDGCVHDERYKVIDDIIYFDGKIYLVPNLELKELIMEGLEPGFHLLEEKQVLGREDYNVLIIK